MSVNEETPQEKPPAQPITLESLRELVPTGIPFVDDLEEEQDIVQEVINDVCDIAIQTLQRSWYEQMVLEVSVRYSVQSMGGLIGWYVPDRDQGEMENPPEDNPTWNPDEEPMPCPLDSWARGAIHVRKLQPQQQTLAPSGPKSIAGRSRAPTQRWLGW
eukprot:GFYU01013180.1.p2 GENE.GFYU01013180.1~~GFYU01013180.1.p2  ORF type:complete len:159 (+),score=39.81 GFYU01013180.1:343-819(+)